MEELSFQPTIINYKREDDSTNALIRQYSKEHKNPLFSIYYNTLWRYSHSRIDSILHKEREKYLLCSQPIYKNALSSLSGKYSLYLTGSDQVWNMVGSGKTKEIDSSFFWEGLDENSNIISYAASFGDSKLSDEDYDRCKKWLRKYKAISVREDSGVKLLDRMGYEATQVLDPTMIIDKKHWEDITLSAKYRPSKRYALIYNLHSNSNMQEFISKDLKGSGLKEYNITTTFRRVIGKNVFCPSISDFLYLFKNASCIYADSFHAIAFAIIFNTPIVITLPKQYSARLESVVRLFGLEQCLVNNIEENGWKENRIDWDKVNKILQFEKDKSKEWLKNTIEKIL